jgi:hypothetical protein
VDETALANWACGHWKYGFPDGPRFIVKHDGNGNQGEARLLSPPTGSRTEDWATGKSPFRFRGRFRLIGGTCLGAPASWSAVALHRFFPSGSRRPKRPLADSGALTKRQKTGAVHDAGAQLGSRRCGRLGETGLAWGAAGLESQPYRKTKKAGRFHALPVNDSVWPITWRGGGAAHRYPASPPRGAAPRCRRREHS